MRSRKFKFYLLASLVITFLFLYICSPYIISNQIYTAIQKKDVHTFSFFINNEELKKNTKEVLMRELSKNLPSEISQNNAAKYLAEKAIESNLNKYMNPKLMIEMFSGTMLGKDKKSNINFLYSLTSPNTFIWDIRYEESKNNFQIVLKRHNLLLWKIEKVDFTI